MAKSKQVQFQADIRNEDEWLKFLQRDGLLVVDIYSDWCGPCLAMQANLKKIKLEVGGDFLQLGMARCDEIEALARFRNKSEPTWMFIAQGKQVRLLFGTNAPELQQVIMDEMRKEQECINGVRMRAVLEPADYSEQEQAEVNRKKDAEVAREMIKAEKEYNQTRTRRVAQAKNILDSMGHLGLILILPHAVSKCHDILEQCLANTGISISKKERPQLTAQAIDEIEFLATEKMPEECKTHLCTEKSYAILLNVDQAVLPGPVEDTVLKWAYGNERQPPGEAGTPGHQLLKSEIEKRRKEAEMLEAEKLAAEIGQQVQREEEHEEDEEAEEEGEGEEVSEDREGEMNVDFERTAEQSMAMVTESMPNFGMPTEVEEEEEEEEAEKDAEFDYWGLWAPQNEMVKGTALKYFFPLITQALILPEEPPTPPFLAIAFDAFKKFDVFRLIADYESDVLQFGFFSSDNPEDARLIAKSKKAYDKHYAEGAAPNEKLILKISKRTSDTFLAFALLGPTYMSSNVVVGERDCSFFFPENYDESNEPEEVLRKTMSLKPTRRTESSVEDGQIVFDSVIHGDEDEGVEELDEEDVEEIPPMEMSELPEVEDFETYDVEYEVAEASAPPNEELPTEINEEQS